MAKEVSLIAVKVLSGGSGSYADVVAGVDYVAGEKRNNPEQPMTANMSLGGPENEDLNNALDTAVNLGVPFAVSAGR